ncbi:hypothetical protein ACTFIW_011499 [Dictyostelium discoideum]
MYKLYKKVFNNLVISKIIWGYVKYEQMFEDSIDGGFLDYSIYDKITESMKTQDLTLGILLKKKMYQVFNYFIDFFFKVAIQNPAKYWYCQLRLQDHNVDTVSNVGNEFHLLLSYKELSFQRFKLIYHYFKSNPEFLKNKETILNVAASTNGNFEIFQFLKREKDENNQPMFNFTLGPQIVYVATQVTNLIPFGESENYKIFLEQIQFYKKDIELNGGVDKLQVLLYSLVKRNLLKHFNYLLTTSEFKKSISKFPKEALVQVACKFSSMEFAKLLIEQGIVPKNPAIEINPSKLFLLVDGSDLQKPLDFQVVKYIWGDFVKNLQLKSSVSMCNINYSEDLNSLTDFNINIILSSISFNPSKEEFQSLIKKDNNNNNNNNNSMVLNNIKLLERVVKNITNYLFDIEYLDIFIQFIFKYKKDFKYPIECFTSKFEIVKYLYENKQLISNYDQVVNENFSPDNLFNGDVKSFEFYLSKNKLKKIEKNPKPTIDQAIMKCYLEIVKFIFNKLNFSNYQFTSINHNKSLEYFNICRFLYKHPKCDNGRLGWLNFSLYNFQNNYNYNNLFLFTFPKLYHFYFNQNKESIGNKLPKNNILFAKDFLLFKQYSKIDPQLTFHSSNLNFNKIRVKLFSTSNYSILEYIVKNLGILPSQSLIERYRKQLIKSISSNNSIHRLLYFIENDKKLIQLNPYEIIENIFNYHGLTFSNIILSHPNYSQDFKLLILISSIMFIIFSSYSSSFSGNSSTITPRDYIIKLNQLKFDQSIIFDNDLIDKSIDKVTKTKKRYSRGVFINYFENSFYDIILPTFSKNNNLIIISRLILIKIKNIIQKNSIDVINNNNNNNNLIFSF